MKKKRFKKVYIEITNVCNLNCEFCINSNRKKRSMMPKEFESIIKQIKPYTDYIYLHIKGEPLIHQNIKEILDISYKYNMKVNLTTNGVLIKEKEAILSNALALRQINISLHSLNQNRNFPISKISYLNNVTDSAEKIMSKNDIYVSYRIWDINEENIDDNDIVTYMSKKYDIDICNELRDKASIKLKNNIFLNVDNTFKWPNLKCDVISEKGSCYGLIDQIGILVDGRVVPCCLDQDGDIVLGNIFEDKLEDILNTKRVQDIINGFKSNNLVEPLCQRCGFRINKRKK